MNHQRQITSHILYTFVLVVLPLSVFGQLKGNTYVTLEGYSGYASEWQLQPSGSFVVGMPGEIRVGFTERGGFAVGFGGGVIREWPSGIMLSLVGRLEVRKTHIAAIHQEWFGDNVFETAVTSNQGLLSFNLPVRVHYKLWQDNISVSLGISPKFIRFRLADGVMETTPYSYHRGTDAFEQAGPPQRHNSFSIQFERAIELSALARLDIHPKPFRSANLQLFFELDYGLTPSSNFLSRYPYGVHVGLAFNLHPGKKTSDDEL